MQKNELPQTSKRGKLSRGLEVFLVGGALAVFAVLSLLTITRSSIWFDESFTAYLIRFDFIGIAHYTSLDVHPPFYYWVLKLWSLVFGNSDLALRSMSVLFGMTAIFFAYLLLRKLFTRRTALWTLPLLTVMPFFIRYAQEARMYTLVATIALAATYVLVLATEKKRWRWWILYGALVSLGMWTHYFAALIWLSHWAWRAGDVYKRSMKAKEFMKAFFTKKWVVAHIVAVGLFAAWVPSLIFQVVVVQANGFWIPPIDPSTVPGYLSTVLYYLTSSETGPWLTVLLLTTAVIWTVVALRAVQTMDKMMKRWVWLITAIAVVPIVLLLIGSLPPLQSSFVDRYLLTSSVALMMLTGIFIAYAPRAQRSTRILRNVLVLLIVGAMVVGVSNVYKFGNYNKFTGEQSAAKQLIAEIGVESVGNVPIIADTPWIFYDAVHYSTDQHTVYFVNERTEYRYGSLEMLRTSDMFKIKDLDAFVKENKYIWFIDNTKANAALPPATGWTGVKTIEIPDPYTKKPAYHAVLYKTS